MLSFENSFYQIILRALWNRKFLPLYKENESQRTQASCYMVIDKITNRTPKSYYCHILFSTCTQMESCSKLGSKCKLSGRIILKILKPTSDTLFNISLCLMLRRNKMFLYVDIFYFILNNSCSLRHMWTKI